MNVSVLYGLETLFWISLRLFGNFFHTTRLRIEYFLYLFHTAFVVVFRLHFVISKLLLMSADNVCLFAWNVSTPYFYGNCSCRQTYRCYCETIIIINNFILHKSPSLSLLLLACHLPFQQIWSLVSEVWSRLGLFYVLV